jgi:hypothetical protein
MCRRLEGVAGERAGHILHMKQAVAASIANPCDESVPRFKSPKLDP